MFESESVFFSTVMKVMNDADENTYLGFDSFLYVK